MRYLVLCLALVACGPAHKLRKAEKLIKAAVAEGAKVKVDTVYKMVDFKLPAVTNEMTATVEDTWKELLVKGKDSISVKIKRIPQPGNKEIVYVEAKCPEVSVKTKVPVAINQKISAGYTLWDMIILAIFCLLVGYFVGRILVSTLRDHTSQKP